MIMGIVSLVMYFVVYPILTWLLSLAHYKMRIEKLLTTKNPKKKLTPEQQRSLLNRWNEKIRFTMTDKRLLTSGKKDSQEAPKSGVQRRFVFFALYLAGVVVSAAQFAVENPSMLIVSLLLYWAAMFFGVQSAKKLLERRSKMLAKMFEIAARRLGYGADESPRDAITVKEWSDPVTPQKIQFVIPTNFGQEGEDNFMRQFNQVFGRETAWVPDTNLKEGINGWDYEKGLLTLRAVPPLPTFAAWDAKWVENPAIAWSFFPLGIGVEDGVEIPNEDGTVTNLIGIDFSGKQRKAAEKAGLAISDKITKTPMALVAGGTGSGKALASHTLVRRVKRTAQDTDVSTESKE